MAALPESKASQSGQSFAFMQLPLEIRTMIYEELLVVPCRIPAVPGRVPAQIIDPKGLYGKDDLYPYTRILEVSKAIYAEANCVLYFLNKFKTLTAGNMKELYVYGAAFRLALQNEGVAELGQYERWFLELRRMTAATLDPDLGKFPKSFYTSCAVSSRLMPEVLNPGEVIKRDSDSSDTICPWDRGEQAAFDLVIFLRSIGPVNAGHIRDLELGLVERWECHQMLYYTEVTRQQMPNLRVLTILFRDFSPRTAVDGPLKSQRSDLDTLPLCLFVLQDTVSHFQHLASLRFRGCIDGFDEIGKAMMKARESGGYCCITREWESLMEKYRSKLNGAGVACVCRRRTCFLASPGGQGWECDYWIEEGETDQADVYERTRSLFAHSYPLGALPYPISAAYLRWKQLLAP